MKVSWVIDVISPFSYLALKELHRVPQDISIECVPVLFAGLLNHHGQKGPAEIQSKRRFTYRYCLWKAQSLGVPMHFPPSHPFNPLMALRLIIAAGSRIEAVELVLDAVFMHGQDVTQDRIIEELGGKLGIARPREAINAPTVKEQLRRNTEWAISRGVFGVPTLIVNDEIFWGHDAVDMALDYVRNPELFNEPEFKAVDELPVGIARQHQGKG
jgi:2-hydroxychromene-2-carboxylate isomerase